MSERGFETRKCRTVPILLFALGFAGCGHRAAPISPADGGAPVAPIVVTDAGARLAPQVQQAVPPPPTKPPPQKVKLSISSAPSKAIVSWGKKELGKTPLTIERSRDSGPLDLVVRKEGYFPLHVRAYTFRNDKVGAQLTKLTDRMTLFGAKKELPPDASPTVPDPSKKQ